MPYGDKKSYSFFKMKYQGNTSAFPFKSPLKEMDLFGLKARRNRRWAKEDAGERHEQSKIMAPKKHI